MTLTGLNPASGQTHHSSIYLSSDDRVLARKLDGSLVELGVIIPQGEVLDYRLHIETLFGQGFLTAEKLLQDVATKLSDIDLDALYAALPSYSGSAEVDLALDPHLEVWTGPVPKVFQPL